MPLTIIHLDGPLAGQEQRFSDSVEVILIGREKDCQVVYPPETTSVGRKHCALIRLGDGSYIIEIFGKRPVEIDGTPVESGTTLKWESMIRLGGPTGPSFAVEITRNLSKRVDVEAEPEPASRIHRPTQASRAPESLPRTKALDMTTLISERTRAAVRTAGLSAEAVASSVPSTSPMPSPVWREETMNSVRYSRRVGPSPLIWLLGATAIALALYFLLRREPAHGASLLRLVPGTMPPPAPAPAAHQRDLVDASVFGPTAVEPGRDALVQVFLHRLDHRDMAKSLAQEADPDTARRGVQTLAAEIERGQRVDFVLEGRGLGVDQERQTLVWRGEPCACQFTVTTSKDASGRIYHPRVLVLVDSVPVGTLSFALKVNEGAEADEIGLKGDSAKRYSYAFLSYASPDRTEVIKRAQGLRAGGTSFFNDLLSLEPGQRWEKRLYQEIDHCDVFYLFWSSRAKDSEWVIKETEYALARQTASGNGEPDIIPVIIEGPPPPAPPEQLKHLHFNDWMLYVLAGEERGASAAH
jgi:predicted component of type VI protein secretion system